MHSAISSCSRRNVASSADSSFTLPISTSFTSITIHSSFSIDFQPVGSQVDAVDAGKETRLPHDGRGNVDDGLTRLRGGEQAGRAATEPATSHGVEEQRVRVGNGGADVSHDVASDGVRAAAEWRTGSGSSGPRPRGRDRWRRSRSCPRPSGSNRRERAPRLARQRRARRRSGSRSVFRFLAFARATTGDCPPRV